MEPIRCKEFKIVTDGTSEGSFIYADGNKVGNMVETSVNISAINGVVVTVCKTTTNNMVQAAPVIFDWNEDEQKGSD